MKSNYMKSLIWLLTMIIMIVPSAQWANAQSVTVNWMSWNAPSSYPLTFNNYWYFKYADGATGSLTMPDTSVVSVSMTGEVIEQSCFTSNECTYFSWLGVQGTTAPYTSASVPSLPPNNDMVAQTGFAAAGHTLTFSRQVENVVMNIYSLGAPYSGSEYTFDQDFEILSQDPRCNLEADPYYFCLMKNPENPKQLQGYEGNGTIQFKGTYSSITWTVSLAEFYSGFNIGVSSAGSQPPPQDPQCSVLNALTLTEAQWHSNSNMNPLSESWFTTKFPNGLVVGKGSRKVTLTSADAIRKFLPEGPKSAVLLSDWTNPGRKLQNSLAGQLVAAKLNLALSPNLTLAKIPAGAGTAFDGMSYKQIVTAADSALGWDGAGSAPTQAELNSLNSILIYINASFSSGSKRKVLVCDVPV